jgi:hypothetical protein
MWLKREQAPTNSNLTNSNLTNSSSNLDGQFNCNPALLVQNLGHCCANALSHSSELIWCVAAIGNMVPLAVIPAILLVLLSGGIGKSAMQMFSKFKKIMLTLCHVSGYLYTIAFTNLQKDGAMEREQLSDTGVDNNMAARDQLTSSFEDQAGDGQAKLATKNSFTANEGLTSPQNGVPNGEKNKVSPFEIKDDIVIELDIKQLTSEHQTKPEKAQLPRVEQLIECLAALDGWLNLR